MTDDVVHPMLGWVAVVPIPDPNEAQGQQEPETIFTFLGGPREPRKITTALVVEVAPIGPGADEDSYPLPYKEGDKVFYPDDRGIPIGDREFIAWNTPIAYTK